MAKRKYSSKFKAEVAVAALKRDETKGQIASRFGIHPGQVRAWKSEFLKNAPLLFEKNNREEKKLRKQMEVLYKKIGQITLERDFLL